MLRSVIYNVDILDKHDIRRDVALHGLLALRQYLRMTLILFVEKFKRNAWRGTTRVSSFMMQLNSINVLPL
jgi:hypothetical protein